MLCCSPYSIRSASIWLGPPRVALSPSGLFILHDLFFLPPHPFMELDGVVYYESNIHSHLPTCCSHSECFGHLTCAAQTYSDSSSSPTSGSSSITSTFSTSTTTSTGSVTHTVQVGPKSSPHAYVPHNLTANPGDVVVFEFYPTNHSVVKADFGAPCVPASGSYFYSGMFNSFSENNGQLIGPVSMIK